MMKRREGEGMRWYALCRDGNMYHKGCSEVVAKKCQQGNYNKKRSQN